jgi:transcriptional regulator with XRE-family HTH domain
MTYQPSHHKPKRTRPINNIPVTNRIRAMMEHTSRYAFRGEARLARDCAVSEAAISRLMSGKTSPSFGLVVRIAQAFEKQLKRHIDLREIVSIDGQFPTSTVCEIVGCRGCTPQAAWNEDDTMKAEYSSPSGRMGYREEGHE